MEKHDDDDVVRQTISCCITEHDLVNIFDGLLPDDKRECSELLLNVNDTWKWIACELFPFKEKEILFKVVRMNKDSEKVLELLLNNKRAEITDEDIVKTCFFIISQSKNKENKDIAISMFEMIVNSEKARVLSLEKYIKLLGFILIEGCNEGLASAFLTSGYVEYLHSITECSEDLDLESPKKKRRVNEEGKKKRLIHEFYHGCLDFVIGWKKEKLAFEILDKMVERKIDIQIQYVLKKLQERYMNESIMTIIQREKYNVPGEVSKRFIDMINWHEENGSYSFLDSSHKLPQQ